MADLSPLDNMIETLSKAVENKEPTAGMRIKELLDNPRISFNEMRYLEGLLVILGESPGELEDAPDIDNDPEEYWEEY
tara:strand:+ start:212 stop:445 length:234 start_codon:yes stop_codon:yes gene_type:complete